MSQTIKEPTREETKTESSSNNGAGTNAPAPTASNSKIEPPAPKKSVVREYFESFVVTLIMAFFGMTFIVQAVTVPTGSMQNTINIGDHLLVNKFIYAPGTPLPFLPMREIRRGDIVVFKYPGNRINPEKDLERDPPLKPYEINYVKRVIGLPGDTIEFRNNQVFVNGQLLAEHRVIGEINAARDQDPQKVPYTVEEFETAPPDATYTVYYHKEYMDLARRNALPQYPGFKFGVPGKETKVPADQYFTMGDARDNSEDSRVWGFVHRDLVVGRAMFVYWSCDQSRDNTFLGCLTNPRFDRIGKLIK